MHVVTGGAILAAQSHSYFDSGFGRFVTSPGLGGLAALLAAIIAGGVAWRSSVRQAEIDAEKARQERWWETLTWTYEHSTRGKDKGAIPARIAIDLFDYLGKSAQTPLETATALHLVDLFKDARRP